MCGRIRIIVKKKRRIAIHHPTSRGDVIIIVKKKSRITIHLREIEWRKMCGRIRIRIIVKKKRRITIHHPTTVGVM